MDDLRAVLESIGRPQEVVNQRSVDRLELSIPAELTTGRGNTIAAMTREISRTGIGLIHRGNVSLGEVSVRIASETREFTYRVQLTWCDPTDNGMFISGGRFLIDPADGSSA